MCAQVGRAFCGVLGNGGLRGRGAGNRINTLYACLYK